MVLSPLEKGDTVLTYIIDTLYDSIIITSLNIYLTTMFAIIFICLFLLSKDIKFTFLNKFSIFNIQIGFYINKFLN